MDEELDNLLGEQPGDSDLVDIADLIKKQKKKELTYGI